MWVIIIHSTTTEVIGGFNTKADALAWMAANRTQERMSIAKLQFTS